MALEAAALERASAEAAKLAQAEADVAWRRREQTRLEEMEESLFPGGQVDHILIDGHNLVHRVFRPEDEGQTRPWLESMVALMAARLEARGWDTLTHLVFDTRYQSNFHPAAHGVRIYFANNTTEGGADAKIDSLLRDETPLGSSCMVISTDRNHVWSSAQALADAEGRDIDLVQIELLAGYLQALGDTVKELTE